MKITMKQIADELGVSIATVSHVINGTKRFPEETHKMVMEAVRKYNYVPNSTAKNLRKKETKTAGLVLSSMPDSYVTGIISGVGNRARELNYHLLFVNSNENPRYESDTIDFLNSNIVDGIILSPTSSEISYIKKYIDSMPIVLINRYDPNLNSLPWVTADDFQAGYDATLHLVQHGHINIGVISAIPGVTTTMNRIKGYEQALKENDISINNDLHEIGYATVNGGFNATLTLLNRNEDISALFILSDLMTIGAIKAIRQLGLKCPDDIAIIGFGDFESASIVDPPITTVNLPPETIGRTAFDALLNKIMNPKYNKHIQLPTTLIIRKSCGC